MLKVRKNGINTECVKLGIMSFMITLNKQILTEENTIATLWFEWLLMVLNFTYCSVNIFVLWLKRKKLFVRIILEFFDHSYLENKWMYQDDVLQERKKLKVPSLVQTCPKSWGQTLDYHMRFEVIVKLSLLSHITFD